MSPKCRARRPLTRARSATPLAPRRQRDPVEDAQYPETWQPTDTHFDVNVVYGYTLPRTVTKTKESEKLKIQGLDIHDIPLHAVLHKGIQNWILRKVAHGRFAIFEAFHSKKEALLASEMCKLFRDHKGKEVPVTIDSLYYAMAHKLGLDASPEGPFEDRVKIAQQLAKTCHQALTDNIPKTEDVNKELIQRIHALESDRARLQACLKERREPTARDDATPQPAPRTPKKRTARKDAGTPPTVRAASSPLAVAPEDLEATPLAMPTDDLDAEPTDIEDDRPAPRRAPAKREAAPRAGSQQSNLPAFFKATTRETIDLDDGETPAVKPPFPPAMPSGLPPTPFPPPPPAREDAPAGKEADSTTGGKSDKPAGQTKPATKTAPKTSPKPTPKRPNSEPLRGGRRKAVKLDNATPLDYTDDPNTFLKGFQKAQDQDKTLGKSAPTTSSPSNVTKWIKSLPLDTAKKTLLETTSKNILRAAEDPSVPLADKPKLEDLLAEHGLTARVAAKLSTNDCARVLAAVYYLTR